MINSIVCRYEHFFEDWFLRQASALGFEPHGADPYRPDRRFHRKLWEYAAIRQALEERGLLAPGKSGCGFAVGKEPLPASFAARGVNILATDLFAGADSEKWESSGQHADDRESLFIPSLIDRATFDKRVRFKPVDMRNLTLPWGETFDFIWSSCSIEHLGSLQLGFDFVLQSLDLLEPGGLAIHTTEFNVASNDETAETGENVVYRRRDIESLDYQLRRMKCGLARCDFYAGDSIHDLVYDVPPFDARHHIKLTVEGNVATSFLMVITKAG